MKLPNQTLQRTAAPSSSRTVRENLLPLGALTERFRWRSLSLVVGLHRASVPGHEVQS